jgi:hypothetical protein
MSIHMAVWCCRSVGLLIHEISLLTIIQDLLGKTALRVDKKWF